MWFIEQFISWEEGTIKKSEKEKIIVSKGAIIGKEIGAKVEIQERARNKELADNNEKKHKLLAWQASIGDKRIKTADNRVEREEYSVINKGKSDDKPSGSRSESTKQIEAAQLSNNKSI